MSAPFEVGDVVVCVDDRVGDNGKCSSGEWIARGQIYRVSMIMPSVDGVKLRGFRLAENEWFRGRRFRKIDDEQIPEVLERLKSLGKSKERVS